MNKKRKNNLGLWFFIIFLIVSGSYLFENIGSKHEKSYSQFVNDIKTNIVTEMVIDDIEVVYKIKNDNEGIYYTTIPSQQTLYDDCGEEISKQMSEGTLAQEAKSKGVSLTTILSVVCSVLIIGMIAFMMFSKKGQVGGFTKNPARLEDTSGKDKVSFADVAGANEEKAELEEIVDFLKNPDKYIKLGARIPKGVLLVGPPGTGKTLLARAVAGEAGVPFFSISGSDFVELYVGVGASRVRDLFEQAKKNRPCIIFIDEIDAVGRKRGAGMGGGHDEREQTLNQLLVEMDGFGKNEGVIVIAATNRPDILDAALLRPGRFDRQIVVSLPDVKGREDILKVHTKNRPLDEKINLESIAKATVGYSGADLENVMNEASIFAARREHQNILQEDIEDANIKVMMGTEKRSKVVTEKEKRLTAFHEAGHAVLTYLADKNAVVNQISIIPRGRAGGYTMSLPKEDIMCASKSDFEADIVVLLGGKAAEEITMNDVTTGASNDLQRATAAARDMVSKYGMSEKIGPVSYHTDDEVFIGRDFGHSRVYSDATAREIDVEVEKILTELYDKAKTILTENRDKLNRLAELLVEKETINGEEFIKCMNAYNEDC